LFVQEIPVETPGEAQMKFAVRMSIPVFVRPVENEHAWDVGYVSLEKQGLSIRVNNTGNRFLMVGAMQAIGRDAEGKEVFRSEGQGWYVLAGHGRGFSLPVNKESCEKMVTLEVAITVNKDTRTRSLNEINCESLDHTISQSPQVMPGK
jgi:P pilus assembly chaperone PapD